LAEDVDQALVRSVVSKLEGFSGREIHKLAVAWQAAAFGRSDATLDEALLLEVCSVIHEVRLEKRVGEESMMCLFLMIVSRWANVCLISGMTRAEKKMNACLG
jgi:hypothetical protein